TFSSNSGDLLFFSGISETLDSSRGPYGLGSRGGRGRGRGKGRSLPAPKGWPGEATARQWEADQAGGGAGAAGLEEGGGPALVAGASCR
uniref:Uncharacterized protein n=1 Tax=Oryza meridionalis TaxID=40149 RepID=A0A0E0EW15_9ORYZ